MNERSAFDPLQRMLRLFKRNDNLFTSNKKFLENFPILYNYVARLLCIGPWLFPLPRLLMCLLRPCGLLMVTTSQAPLQLCQSMIPANYKHLQACSGTTGSGIIIITNRPPAPRLKGYSQEKSSLLPQSCTEINQTTHFLLTLTTEYLNPIL